MIRNWTAVCCALTKLDHAKNVVVVDTGTTRIPERTSSHTVVVEITDTHSLGW
jgi:hypothetical protein